MVLQMCIEYYISMFNKESKIMKKQILEAPNSNDIKYTHSEKVQVNFSGCHPLLLYVVHQIEN